MTVREAKTRVHRTDERQRKAAIRALNDDLRCHARGGVICITSGIQALGREALIAILIAVREFDTFTRDNDPHGEHDLGIFRAAGQRLLWKIDYYDLLRRYASPDPADANVTARVLTIMLASEY